MNSVDTGAQPDGIAIIGMACRVPGARDLTEFWQKLRDGVECLSFFSTAELAAAGVDAALLQWPTYVQAGGPLEDVELFDAGFFGFNPREAELMDPQHRIFLETAWTALEHAGYDSARGSAVIGMYAGVGMNTYLLNNVYPNRDFIEAIGDYQTTLGNEKDFVPTRVSYKLNLQGPSVNVQTGCSSSLVAVHLACQSLLNGECDMALAGGVSITVPQKTGYLYHEGGILSPDGHCRAFAAGAQGTVSGNGLGIVVLKRLAEAVADGDTVYAVIKGSALNNDGSRKIGYTAPSIDGQAAVIDEALAIAAVDAATISYIEAHGTGTPLGDPIEIAALTQAFRASTPATGFCALGSVKTNIGHLDAAAGVVGLIKTALALTHAQIPPSLHFDAPNPQIDFAGSPFYVNATLRPWPRGAHPRRAGVSSFGIGGTNAHLILEEAPEARNTTEERPWQLLLLSAKTDTALAAMQTNLAAQLRQQPATKLADVAYTLQTGRRELSQRRMLVCRDREDALRVLESVDGGPSAADVQEHRSRSLIFMFPGQGSQHIQMGRGLYEAEPVFRAAVDRCAEILKAHLHCDLRDILYPAAAHTAASSGQINQTGFTQPAIFVISYALAQLWLSWGIQMQAMIGHSIGEYVAACLADVMSLEDALALVAARGQLMQQLPGGAMVAVSLAEDATRVLLSPDLAIAAVNGSTLTVVAGPDAAAAALEGQLQARGVGYRRLHTSHAFHSPMMEPITEQFTALVRTIRLHAPRIPYISNLSGSWITAAEATDPGYWARHLRRTVRFADGLATLLATPEALLLEVGPGTALVTACRQHPARQADHIVLQSMRHPHDQQADDACLLKTLGQLWLAGTTIDWAGYYQSQQRRHIALPTYPFERQRFWLEAPQHEAARPRMVTAITDWCYVPSWKRTPPARNAPTAAQGLPWLLFSDAHGCGAVVAAELARAGQDVTIVTAGHGFSQPAANHFVIDPAHPDQYHRLLSELTRRDKTPKKIIYMWYMTQTAIHQSINEQFEQAQEQGLRPLLYLTQALGRQNEAPALQIAVVSNNVFDVVGTEALQPAAATLLAPLTIIPLEYLGISCQAIDIDLDCPERAQDSRLIKALSAELLQQPAATSVALRGTYRWVQTCEPLPLAERPAGGGRLRQGGVYLITGGLDDSGQAIAEYLLNTLHARVIVIDPIPRPEPSTTPTTPPARGDQLRVAHRLQELGGELWVTSIDVSAQNHVRGLLTEIDARYGGLHGVFHTATPLRTRGSSTLQETDVSDCLGAIRTQVQRFLALDSALQGRALDFCLIDSSIAALAGGSGLLDYAAAQQFMAAMSYRQRRAGQVLWQTVHWDTGSVPVTLGAVGIATGKHALTPVEGRDMLDRLFADDLPLPEVIISKFNMQQGLPHWREQQAADLAASSGSHTAMYPRPAIQNSYTPPTTAQERAVAAIWQELLGITTVGLHDNFFDLGGHSLLATQLLARLQETFQVELSLRSLFDAPTVAQVCQVITTQQIADADSALLAETLAELELLSEDEVRMMLAPAADVHEAHHA